MTPAQLQALTVAFDGLHEAGVGVTAWDLCCLAAWRASVAAHGLPKVTEYNTPAAHAEQRLKSDLFGGSLDALHGEAQWEAGYEAERRAGRLTRLRPAAAEPSPFQDALL